MNYYINERQADTSQSRTAGSKAREDAEFIFEEERMTAISIAVMQEDRKEQRTLAQKLKAHYQIYKEWKEKTEGLLPGDVLFIQFPCLEHTLYLHFLLSNLKKRKVRTVLLIHDLELLRISKEKRTKLKKKIRLRIEEFSCLKRAGIIISHNPSMTAYLEHLGILKDNIITLGIFDYLIPKFNPPIKRDKNKVIIAGNLAKQKAGYVYSLPGTVQFELYGVNYTGNQNGRITYHGSYPSDELPNVMEGGFGLVWDGTSSKSCEGIYGNYLKINNPHKTSLYLACGVPVLIWGQAALAQFVLDNHCGVLLDSLDDIATVLNTLSQEKYDILMQNTQKIGERIREGAFLKEVIADCLNGEVAF